MPRLNLESKFNKLRLESEKQILVDHLKKYKYNTDIAKELGVSSSMIAKLLRKHDLKSNFKKVNTTPKSFFIRTFLLYGQMEKAYNASNFSGCFDTYRTKVFQYVGRYLAKRIMKIDYLQYLRKMKIHTPLQNTENHKYFSRDEIYVTDKLVESGFMDNKGKILF